MHMAFSCHFLQLITNDYTSLNKNQEAFDQRDSYSYRNLQLTLPYHWPATYPYTVDTSELIGVPNTCNDLYWVHGKQILI